MNPSLRVPHPADRLRRSLYKHRWTYFLLLPTLLYFLFFHYFPMYGIQMAFKDFAIRRGISGSPWVGLRHFQTIFKSQVFLRTVRNTLLISLYKLAFGMSGTIVFALMINEMRWIKLKRIAQTIAYLPHFISWVVLGGIIGELLSPTHGVVNYLVSFLGGQPKLWLLEPGYFRSILVVAGIWKEVGWGSIIYLAAIAGIAVELYEAAEIDGASRLQIIRYVILPSILPVISIQFILQLGGILNAGFDQVFNLYNDVVMVTGDIIDTYVYRVGLTGSLRYSQATAIGLFKNIIGLVLVIGTNMIVRRIGEGEYKIW
ncbi:MAG TPA: ABC transporter permease subunit [Clostridia bacterium]|nr:ABC transporter permease subunit [Clostridia bacterium]